MKRVFGQETEYALHDAGGIMSEFYSELCGLLKYATGEEGKWFINGSRFYIDSSHPEYATPECSTPMEVVRAVNIGHKMMASVDYDIYNNCVDYDSLSTWGTHESYSYKKDLARSRIYRNLTSHLVSRIIYTGAGGLVPGARGIQFTMSPRVHMLSLDSGGSSTSDRAIIDGREEPLDTKHSRLHLICGDGTRSEKSTYLKFGTTALILTLLEQGINPCSRLNNPLEAMKKIAQDPSLKVKVHTAAGTYRTAMQLQEECLASVSCRLHESYMPEWAGEVCDMWRETLQGLKDGITGNTTIDWTTKYNLFNNIISGYDVSSLILCGNDETQKLKAKLQEIDLLYHKMGGTSIFESLDKNNVLEHSIGLGDIDISWFPKTTRAAARCEALKEYNVRCVSWNYISTRDVGNIQLDDPFDTELPSEKIKEDKSSIKEKIEKLQIGTKVLIARPHENFRNWNDEMNGYIGLEDEIIEVCNDWEGIPTYKVSNNRYYWLLTSLDLIPITRSGPFCNVIRTAFDSSTNSSG